jgi:3-deoxy-D-manno-octulosonate 8-phosphate phosphatase (KDO 8-P phosphatase)
MEKTSQEFIEKVSKIKLLLTDCDGVLTDGCVYYSNSGEVMKCFSLRDGMGVERLRKYSGVETGIVTGENSEIVQRRAEKLGITEYHPGSCDKYSTLKEILRTRNISSDQVAYIGDDLNDLEIMQHVGLSACPKDAMSLIRKTANLIMVNKGGHGAFRELAEIIIFYKHKAK